MLRLAMTLLAITALAAPTWAAEGKGSLILSVAGVVNDRVTEVTNDRPNNEMNVGGGLLVQAAVNDHFGIESGAILINRQYDLEKMEVRLVQEVKRLHIPILARYAFSDYFSIGAGPYLALKTGSVKNSLEIGDVGVGVSTSADEDLQWGWDVATTFNIAFNDKTGLFVEGRYSTLMDHPADERTDELTGLAGLKIDI